MTAREIARMAAVWWSALNTKISRLNATSQAEQLEALKYVVHLVADVHQPLHAGFADDRGGNTYQLQAFGRGTNLHAVWDSQMLRSVDAQSMVTAGSLSARTRRQGPVRPFPPSGPKRAACSRAAPTFIRRVNSTMSTFERSVPSRESGCTRRA